MSDKIQVAIKVRPLVAREEDVGEFWRVKGNELYLLNNDKQPTGDVFAFDHVFANSSNMEVFEEVVKPLVNRAVKGFNATIFAYGQTSSGKTHTMLGDQKEAGITQLAVSAMFDFMKKSEGREFLVRASYMEIYNEKVNDLLEQQNNNLKIREEDGKIVVGRLKEELVADTTKVMNLLKRGQKIRRIGETNLNERSSRSHTIFRLIIESRESGMGDDGTIQVSQLNLVDLAGSERAGLAGTTGERLKEGCAINRSLFQLSQVVSQLSEGSQFVNFRDSKLTRILQCSLGGNAHTLIICTVTPASVDFTLSTLGFASRAKAVKNKPQVNEVMSDGTLIKKYARQLEKLQSELQAAKERNASYELEAVESKLEEQERLNSELQKRINVLMKTLIVAERVPKPRFNRRRTWGGGHFTHLDLPRGDLGTIEEENTSLVLSNEDFNTPYEDFEVQLIEDEKCISDILPSSEMSLNLGNSSFCSSIPSNRASRNFSLSTHEECKEVETSNSITCTPVRHIATNTTPPSANSLYWGKEKREQYSFVAHENDLILELENQLDLNEKKLGEMQKSLTEKDEILKNTLSFQESLTVKLIEYEQALEIAQKEKEINSDKIETFHEDNKKLKMKIQDLEIQNKVNSDTIVSFKEKLFKEVVSLNPDYASQITDTSEPNEVFNVLMNCIMEKQMEIISQLQCQNIQSHHKNPEHMDSNILEEENCQLRAALEKLQQELVEFNIKSESFQNSKAELELQVEQLRVHNNELKTQLEFVYQEKCIILETYTNSKKETEKEREENTLVLERALNDKCSSEEKLEEQARIKGFKESNSSNELYLQTIGNESERDYIQKRCREQEETTFALMEKVKSLEDSLQEVNLQNGELKEQIVNLEKEMAEKVMSLDNITEDKQAMEQKFQEQVAVMRKIETTKSLEQSVNIFETECQAKKELLLEFQAHVCNIPTASYEYVQKDHEEAEHQIKNNEEIYLEQEEKLSAYMEKIDILENLITTESQQRVELQEKVQILEKEKAENILALEKALNDKHTLEEKLEDQTRIIHDLKEANSPHELFLQTTGNKSEIDIIQNRCRELEETSFALMEKVNSLEDSLQEVNLQNGVLKKQIFNLEKEMAEKVMGLENITEDKRALEEKLKEQAAVIRKIEIPKSLEQCVSVFETEFQPNKESLPELEVHMCNTPRASCDEYVQTDHEETEHEIKSIKEKYLEQEGKLSAFMEKISILENQITTDSLQRLELQEKVEIMEKEKAENVLALEKALNDKCYLEEKLEEQARIIEGFKEANSSHEMYLQTIGNKSEIDIIQNRCREQEETSYALMEKVKSLEDNLQEVNLQNGLLQEQIVEMEKEMAVKVKSLDSITEDKIALEEKLEVQAAVIREIETKKSLEQSVGVFETECQAKKELLSELQAHVCNVPRANCDEYVQTDHEENEHGIKSIKERYLEQEGKLSVFMEKISILENQIITDSLQRVELQQKVEVMEKEKAENVLALEKALNAKCSLEEKLQDQTRIINDFTEANSPHELSLQTIEKESETDYIQNRCREQETFALMEKVKSLEDSLQQVNLQNGVLKEQIVNLEKEMAEKVMSLENIAEDKRALEEKLEEQEAVISKIETTKSLEQCVSVFETECKAKKELLSELELHLCNTPRASCDEYVQTDHEETEHEIESIKERYLEQEGKLSAFMEKISILEKEITTESQLRVELQEKVEILEKERAENTLVLEKALNDKCSLEEKLEEQARMIEGFKEANSSHELYLQTIGNKSEIDIIQNRCRELEETSCAFMEKVKSLEDNLQQVNLQNGVLQEQIVEMEKEMALKVKSLNIITEDKIALEEKLEVQEAVIREIETKKSLEQSVGEFETECQAKKELLLELQGHVCNIPRANCDEYVQTDHEETEHGIKSIEERYLEQEGKLSAFMEKISILENQITTDSVQRVEFQEQIAMLEKESAENMLLLEKALNDKCSLEEKLEEQTKIVNDLKEANNGYEQYVKTIGKESRKEQMQEKNKLNENVQEKCGNQEETLFTLMEKVRILEEQGKQDFEQIEKLQVQIKMTENERLESMTNLEKALVDKCSLTVKIDEQNLIIKEREMNNSILENRIRNLESELKEKSEMLLVLQKEKCELEIQLCSTKDKLSSIPDSEHIEEMERKLKMEVECKREKELELAHLQKKLIEQDKQLRDFVSNEKVLEDELKLVVLQKEEMQDKIEKLEKNMLECDVYLQNVFKDKIALEEKVEQQNKIIKDAEESKSTMMLHINELERELTEKRNMLLDLQEYKNEIEKHNKNLEETVKMKHETFESIKMELENNLQMELEHKRRLQNHIAQSENEIMELKQMLSASTENLEVLKEELNKEVLNNKDMKSLINALEKSKLDYEMKLKRGLEEKQVLEKKIDKQVKDFEESQVSFQQQIHELEKELNDQKTVILDMEKQKSELEGKRANLESQIENLEKEKSEFEEKLKEISNYKSEVERELAFTQKKLCEKERMFNDVLDEVKDLEEQFKKGEELKKEMQKQLAVLIESKSNWEEQLNIEINQRENITSELSEVTCRCTQQERIIKELENCKASLEEELHDTLENCRSSEEVVKILKIQHNEEIIFRENMKKDLMSKEEELVQCRKQIQEQNNTIDSLQFKVQLCDSQVQDLQAERMKLVENLKAQSMLESKLKEEVQCLQEQLYKLEEKLMKVQGELQISVNATMKENVIKQELISKIQSLENEKKEYELYKKGIEERKQFRFRGSDVGEHTAQLDEKAKEWDQIKNENEYFKEIMMKQLRDSRKLCQEHELKIQRLTTERDCLAAENTKLKHFDQEQDRSSRETLNPLKASMQTKCSSSNESFNLLLQNMQKQLDDEIKAKMNLENKLLLMQNELTSTKNSEEKLRQEMENKDAQNICYSECITDLNKKLEVKDNETISQRLALKTLFRMFRSVVHEQQSPVEKLCSIIRHLRTQGISETSGSALEKEKLESKIVELEKTVESLHETLKREGYHYSSPHWVRMGNWAISNRKMRQLERRNLELQEEVDRLKGNKNGSPSDEGWMDDTLFGRCLKSPPKPPDCLKCEECKKEVAQLKDELGTKNLRISCLTLQLESGDTEIKRKLNEQQQVNKALKHENTQLRHECEVAKAEAKKQAMKRHQETQTNPNRVPWERLRALGSGSKIADDHVIERLHERLEQLQSDKEKLKEVARALKRRNKELESEKQGTSTTEHTTHCGSSSAAVTPRRAALQRLVRDANEIIAEQRKSEACTHYQCNKENPCHLPEQK